jgi:hypothetical protein
MAIRMSLSRWARARRLGVVVLTGVLVLGLLTVTGSRSVANDVVTNDEVVKMVKAGLPESLIIQKIRSSERKLDTSADALIKLKSAGVPDKVIEAMLAPGSGGTAAAAAPPAAGAPAGSVQATIAHVVGSDQKPLKSVLGSMEFKVQPFGGSRQEVVLPEPKAQYRITQADPVFVSPTPDHQWILVRLKPGKRDRNLPMSNSSGFWTYGGATFRQGVDPKYAIKLTSEPGPNATTQLKPAEPLKPGEYGWVAASRGQINLNEVFDFAVD